MLRSTDATADFAEAENTAITVTSATPIMSAEAVEAVRRGWRIALPLASLPTGPRRERRPRPLCKGAGDERGEKRHPDERDEGAETNDADCVVEREHQSCRQHHKSDTGDSGTGADATSQGPRHRLDRSHRRHRWNLGGSPRWHEGGHHRDPNPHDHANHDGSRCDHEGVGGNAETERGEGALQDKGDENAGTDTDDRCDQSDEERLDHHHHRDLAHGCAYGAQQRQLPGPLRHDDAKCVLDEECPDEHGNPGDHKKKRVDESETLVDLLEVGLCLVFTSDHLGVGGKQVCHLNLHEGGIGRRVEHDGNLVHLALGLEDALCRLKVEHGERRTHEVVGLAECGDA